MAQERDLKLFAQSVGHDFNNLLTGIIGAISLAQQEVEASSPAKSKLDQAILCARRATHLTRQLLSLSDSRRAPVADTEVDVNEVLLKSRDILEMILPTDAVLSYKLAPALPRVKVDFWDLQGICLSLTANAGEALSDGTGVVTVTSGLKETSGASPHLKNGESVSSST